VDRDELTGKKVWRAWRDRRGESAWGKGAHPSPSMIALRLAPLALLLIAPLAVAQSPVFEVRDASGATLHFAVNDDGTVTCTDCISGAEIADGTVAPADIQGSLFNGLTRSQLYERTGETTISGVGFIATSSVACDVAEDIPVTGSCFTFNVSEADLQRFGPTSWDNPSAPAIYSCAYKNRREGNLTIRATITCLDVTPEAATRTAGDDSLDLGAPRTGDL